jgi:hypothetical protein
VLRQKDAKFAGIQQFRLVLVHGPPNSFGLLAWARRRPKELCYYEKLTKITISCINF